VEGGVEVRLLYILELVVRCFMMVVAKARQNASSREIADLCALPVHVIARRVRQNKCGTRDKKKKEKNVDKHNRMRKRYD